MLGEKDIIAFVATTDPERSKEFYKDVLGLKFIAHETSAVVFDAHGIMLRISVIQEPPVSTHTVLGWAVDDIRAEAEVLIEKGVVLQRYEMLDQDEIGIWITPDGTKVAWFQDPDGNLLSLTEFPDPIEFR